MQANSSNLRSVLAADSVRHKNQEPTLRVDGGNAFGGAYIPDADGFVSGRRDEQIRVGGMPAELIHAVTVTSVVVLFHLQTNITCIRHPSCATLQSTSTSSPARRSPVKFSLRNMTQIILHTTLCGKEKKLASSYASYNLNLRAVTLTFWFDHVSLHKYESL